MKKTVPSLWELADFVSFHAMSGTVVVFVVCSNVLCDKKRKKRDWPSNGVLVPLWKDPTDTTLLCKIGINEKLKAIYI